MLSLRQNKRSSFPGHAPGKDTLRAANAATKEGFTGRKRVKRKRLPVVFPSFSERGQTGENARANAVSGRALSPVKIKIPVASADMRRHSDTLRAANAAMKEGANGGENGLSVSDYPLSSPSFSHIAPFCPHILSASFVAFSMHSSMGLPRR